jgi:septal ring factor EnvC (AmiA/AmiB activator)
MEEMHDALTIGIPLMAILSGILLNRQDVSSLRSEMSTLRNDLHGEIGSIRAELRSEIGSTRAEIGSVRTEINALRSEMHSRLDSIQRDMREFYAEQARHDVRITKLEQAKP